MGDAFGFRGGVQWNSDFGMNQFILYIFLEKNPTINHQYIFGKDFLF